MFRWKGSGLIIVAGLLILLLAFAYSCRSGSTNRDEQGRTGEVHGPGPTTDTGQKWRL